MNKKVLTTAQVRAMFKNYTMSLAVAGSVLTSASCEKGDGKKDGKSGETPSAEDAKKFVTKDDLTNATKDLAKSSSVTAVSYDDATKTLTVAGKPVKIEAGSGLSVADLTKKGYKLDNDKIVETSNDKEQRTIVDILKDLMGGSTGVSLDSTEFKIDAGKLVKKDATADAAIINKTVSELIVDMITDKLKDTVNKNDAKIVVKAPLQNPGSAYAASSNEYTHKATFDAANTVDNTKEERTLDLGKEIVGAKTEVEALKAALDAERVNLVVSAFENSFKSIAPNLANAANVGGELGVSNLRNAVKSHAERNKTISLFNFKGCFSTGEILGHDDSAVLVQGQNLEIGDLFVHYCGVAGSESATLYKVLKPIKCYQDVATTQVAGAAEVIASFGNKAVSVATISAIG